MYRAVHSDRSGRIYVSQDWGACGFDGAAVRRIEDAIALPEGSRLVPLPREAQGLDRLGRTRPLGPSRWALGAVLPPGATRTLHPAYRDDDPHTTALEPLATAALCADEQGALFVAARGAVDPPIAETGRPHAALPASSRIARQLTRCARDHACGGARDAQSRRGMAALPVAASANESPPPSVAPQVRPDASPTERAAFRPSAAEIAQLALAHLDGGGAAVSFGRACEGEPLTVVRLIEDAVARIRSERSGARIHLETNGSSAAALRRLVGAGITEVTIRLASARGETYELLHGPVGYRFTEVRASVAAALDAGAKVALAVLVLPGLTDRELELEALADLGDEAHEVRPRDLAADAHRALALLPRDGAPIGIDGALARLLAR